MKKRGQMKLSFGMIFSIFLVIVFLAFAFYAIQKFLSLQEEIQIKQFTENFQNQVNKLWASNQGQSPFEAKVPDKIVSICFRNEEKNLQLNFDKGFNTLKIEHLSVEKLLGNKNKFCILNENNKVKFTLEKSYGNPLVEIKV
jgi:H+/gluconate symporter-like permease